MNIEKLSIFLSPITLALISLTRLIENKYIYSFVLFLFLISLVLTIIKILNIVLKKESLELYELALLPTFCMAMMMFSNVLIYINYSFANIVWIIFFIIHLSIIFLFTKFKFYTVRHEFIPGYMIVYVGILSASISGAVFNHQLITNFILLIGAIGLLYLLPKLISYCMCNRDCDATPFKMISLAPFSLVYLGVKSNYAVSNIFLDIVFFFVLLSTIYGIYLILHLKKENLNFTISALTFPIVINTIALSSFVGDLNIILLNNLFNIYKFIIIIFILSLSFVIIYKNIKLSKKKNLLK